MIEFDTEEVVASNIYNDYYKALSTCNGKTKILTRSR